MEETVDVNDYFEGIEKAGTDNIEKILSCVLCKTEFPKNVDVSDLVSHVRTSHPNDSDAMEARSIQYDRQLKNYFEQDGEDEGAYRCCQCDKTIRSMGNPSILRAHLRNHPETFQRYHNEALGNDCGRTNYIESMTRELARWHRKGSVCEYYEIVNAVERRARCLACNGIYTYRSTVGNLKFHLKKLHPKLYRDMRLADGFEEDEIDVSLDLEHEFKQTIDLGDFFEKYEDDEDGSLTCIVCKKRFDDDEGVLVSHLFSKHPERMEVYKAKKRKKKNRAEADPIWEYFEVYDKIAHIAKCKHCDKPGSYESGTAELTIHLSKEHPELFETFMERKLDVAASDDETAESNVLDWTDYRRRSHRKNRSVLWDYFVKNTGGNATCNFCGRSLAFRSTTGNLSHHLRARHPKAYRQFLIDQVKAEVYATLFYLAHSRTVGKKET